MHIKRFEAPTMIEAVRKVKEELGAEALVLSTRTVEKQKGLFGMMSRSMVEVTAAVDRDVRRAEASGEQQVGTDPSWQELRMTRALVDPLGHELKEVRRLVEQIGVTSLSDSDLALELGELRRTTSDLARRWLPTAKEPMQARYCGRLLEAGLAPRHAFELGEQAALSGTGSPGALRDVLARRLDDRLDPPRMSDGPRVSMFVGPTGVGKTTTLAKIAARERHEEGGVAVLTADTYRIGAEEHLRTFAELLDVPFGVTASAEDLVEQTRGSPKRRILVDTAGRSRRNPDSLAQLRRFRELVGCKVQVNLVLSATTKDVDLRAEVEAYRSVEPDSLIVTKLDESDDYGNIANLVLDDIGPPLSWTTNGQRVPEDLDVPSPGELADRVLGGRV